MTKILISLATILARLLWTIVYPVLVISGAFLVITAPMRFRAWRAARRSRLVITTA